MYIPTSSLQDAISKRDEFLVRGALVGVLQSDHSLNTHNIKDAIAYAEGQGITVFEDEFDTNYAINNDRSSWDSLYWATAITYLSRNFSRERLAHVIEVDHVTRRIVAEPKQATQQTPKQTAKPSANNVRDEHTSKGRKSPNPHKSHIGIAIAAAAAGVAIVAIAGVLLFRN